MKPELDLTSVPAWAAAAREPEADLTGRFWTIVGFGADARSIVERWTSQIDGRRPGAHVSVHLFEPDADVLAAESVSAALADALVGWRLMIAGPAAVCLRLRAHALRCGVADDEILVASTTVAVRDVACVHCGARTSTEVGIEGVVPCIGCGRNLLVYYHVSRLKGAHLGFMVDAEEVAS
ncbi:hypothetical protein BVC93_20870 [Mycobacterium sp. MS1601]|uniref:dimethylamine monooxygenase subunit DmmA family protein n=1 Tax=Mycobacterium sp. MS1601 TaxID=1936029 RepID=UPI0009794F39|nr:dimethylamine monooxygenase subunit DmmA family protein [Mycobacterium sp. MS1601]AQA04469.1 hypothetical protein BVC93_20870 [Mycobacterium sp. MS1601]